MKWGIACRFMNVLVLSAFALTGASSVQAERSSAASDPSNSQAARAWQASYMAEAVRNYDGALKALNQLPASERNGYLANLRRGWLQYSLGHYAEAVAAYGKAIRIQPDAIEARVAQLLPLTALGKWKDVIKAAQDTLKRAPQNYLALQRLAYAQYSSQHFPQAEQTYRRLVRMYPSDVEMRAALGWAVLRMGKTPEALELFRSVLELSPKHASATAGMQAAAATRGAKLY